MATSNRKINNSSSVKNSSSRDLSLTDIQSHGREETYKAYIKELDGNVYYKSVSAAGTVGFLESDTSVADQIRAMARFLTDALCDEDGNPLYSSPDLVMETLPIETIEYLASGIAAAKSEERNARESKRGNVSRR